MRRALNALILLYPKAWRNRYEDEFDALLEQVQPTWSTLFDVFGGALKMQMKSWSLWKTVAAFASLGMLAALTFSFTVPNRYVSTALIKVEGGRLEKLSSIVQSVESRSSLGQLIHEQRLYQGELSGIPLEDAIEQTKKDITLAPIKTKGDPAFSISFAAADAGKAQQTVNRLVGQFMDASVRASADSPGSPKGTFALLDPASPPVLVGPRRSRILLMGVGAGSLVGLLLALFSGLKMWKLAASLGMTGAVLFGAASFLAPERFSSSAVLAYDGKDTAHVRQIMSHVMSNRSLDALAVRSGFDPKFKFREHLHVQEIQDARGIAIQFDCADRGMAQRVTQEVTSMLLQQSKDFETLDAASFPQTPFFPNRSMAAGTGSVFGLAIAMIFAIQKRRVRHE